MAIAITLQQFLDSKGIAYDCLDHARTVSAARSAEASHISGDCLAKAVVLRQRDGYLLAIVPASRQVSLDEVGGWLQRPIGLATEAEIAPLFPDCELGAVPPVAAAYGLHALVDHRLDDLRDVYFEAGDHHTLVHLTGDQFRHLMHDESHGRFSDGAPENDAENELYYAGA